MHIEHELETLLKRLVPGCEHEWLGVTSDEVEELEVYAERKLPAFYYWFLTTMGKSMGPLANPREDMTVDFVLSYYRWGFIPPEPNLLLVGMVPDKIVPRYLYCDMGRPTRSDALVRSFDLQGGFIQNEFETLREKIAWDAFIRFRMNRYLQQCMGTVRSDSGYPLAQLEPALLELGFAKLLTTGPLMGIYERSDAGIECILPPGDSERKYLFFSAGSDDEVIIRNILGTIAMETSLEIHLGKWLPAIPR